MSSKKGITILGSTGTIGVNTLDVVQRHADFYDIVALTANTGVDRLYEQCIQYSPRYAALVDEDSATQLADRLRAAGSDVQVLQGLEGLQTLASLP
jgi:1-deoxy-D-xylulose-5-phosphate reductoisomerase